MSSRPAKPVPAADAPRDAAGTILSARGVYRSYSMGRVSVDVLRDCSLEVRQGEFLAIMGKSGSGKSTLLHILGALDTPQRGQVEFKGRPIFAPESRRRQQSGVFDALSGFERHRNRLRTTTFGFVFQFYHLLPELTVLENVLLPWMVHVPVFSWPAARGAARQRANELLERVGLSHRLSHRPNELSGGERQRAAIARALVHGPQMLLADEPTGNLDAQAGRRIMEILSEFHAAGQTTVMVTHDGGIAQYADRVLHLEQGRLTTER